MISKSIILKYDEELYTCSKVIGDKIFIDATFDFGQKQNPFDMEDRDYPIFYQYTIENRTTVSLNLPEGYTLESVPENMNVVLPDQKRSFSFEIKNQNDKILIYYIFKINDDIFVPSEYLDLKALYDQMMNKSREKIVLKKV